MIRITEEYRIVPHKRNTLRHFCPDAHRFFYMYGASVWPDGHCYFCKKITPKKILFMYNLWKWHNG